MTFISQVVRDIHIPPDSLPLADEVGRLWAWLKNFHFIPKEKVTGEFSVLSVQPDTGIVSAKLTGTSLGQHQFGNIKASVELPLPLGLIGYSGSLDVQTVFETTPGATVETGGNVQNMLLDSLVISAALARRFEEFSPQRLRFSVASSSDPFRGMDTACVEQLRPRVTVFPLSLPDRLAIILPRRYNDAVGVLNVTSEPTLTESALLQLLKDNPHFAKAFSETTTFVSTDPLFAVLNGYAIPPYTPVINASTAFRALAALHAYDTATLLPMNESEAAAVCQILLSRAGIELNDARAVPFPSPLALSGEDLDPVGLRQLNEALGILGRYIHAHRAPNSSLALSYPISFGGDGGLIVGVDGRMLACFTSTPSTDGEKRLFEEFSFEWVSSVRETGAGDSVAALMMLFNTVSAETVVAPFLRGEEKGRKEFCQLAGTLFVAIGSRLVGNILVRTTHTNMSHVDVNSLAALFEAAAEESVKQARLVFKRLPHPTFSVIEKWGIRCACWAPTGSFFANGALYEPPSTAQADH